MENNIKDTISKEIINCNKESHYEPKEKQMENISEDFEDKIESAFWVFNDKLSKKNFSDRDCFKQTLRRYFGKKEKPMENKVIFESDEGYIKLLEDTTNYSREYIIQNNLKFAKQKGYIRKSAVEEAEEIYHDLDACEDRDKMWKTIHKQHEAIQEQKKEIEEYDNYISELEQNLKIARDVKQEAFDLITELEAEKAELIDFIDDLYQNTTGVTQHKIDLFLIRLNKQKYGRKND